MPRIAWSWSVLVLAMSATAQQAQLEVHVVRTWQLDLDHGAIGPLEHREIPVGTVLRAGQAQWLRAATGHCTADGVVAVERDPSGNAMMRALFDCRLHAANNGHPASAVTSGELLLQLQAPIELRGTLLIAVDSGGSSGPATAADMLIDIGDDGIGDYGHGTAAPGTVMREFACTATPVGTPIRITHGGDTRGSHAFDATCVIGLRLTFVPGVSPIVPYRDGPERLSLLRSPSGVVLVGFAAPPTPDTFWFLTVGAPIAPATRQLQVAVPWLLGDVHTTLAATRMLTQPTMGLAPRLLPGTGQACLQGFVFRGGMLFSTNSFLVN